MHMGHSLSSFQRTTKKAHIATRLLSEKILSALGHSPNHEKLAAFLAQTLGTMKGPVMKVAQILATVPGVLPAPYAEEFLHLTNDAPAMGPLFTKRRLVATLGEGWQDHFSTFDTMPAFAASLGQVHQATLKNGQSVAVKLQYPDMHAIITQDLRSLRLLSGLYQRYGKALQTQDLESELAARLYEELDYAQEAKHVMWFQKALATIEGVRVPKVIPHLCRKDVITLEWLEGQPLLTCTHKSQEIRKKIATRLFRAWWVPFYRAGLIHGDPHLGNYTIDPQTHAVNVLDFGCVRLFKADDVIGLYNLFRGFTENNTKQRTQAYQMMGFEKLNPCVQEALDMWARFLYAPMLENKTVCLTPETNAAEGARLAAHVHERLRENGGVKPPRSFLFLDRAAVGIGAALMRLQVPMNWHALFQELIADFKTGSIKENIAATQKKITGTQTETI